MKTKTYIHPLNYLAHFYLSGNDEELLAGQFLGDIVKGRDYENYPPLIRAGILLHRFIDSETESHFACREFRATLRPYCGLHSPIAVDMLLDHVFASRWNEYSEIALHDFAEKTYMRLSNKVSLYPEKTRIVLHYMKEHNWLLSYASTEGMKRCIRGLAKRVRGGSALEKAADNLETLVVPARSCFESYFPHLVTACTDKINIFAHSN
ncbi:MAG: DUF479 domain-containing protein [Crocinitomicaceae bacterium]|nr:DUF479 domain-containing protein [Crocinitomicaceae bacterium]